jgi:hypothetical protein
MKQTAARNGRKKIAQGKRRENERRPGFNKQNKILPLLAERGEGRGEESKNPGTCRAAAHGVISSRQSMSPELFNELRKLRNEVAHGMQNPDASELVKRLEKLGLTVSISDLPSFASSLVEMFGKSGGEFFIPQLVVQTIAALVEGRSARLAVDPWAGLGVVAATIGDVTKATKTLACTRNEREACCCLTVVQANRLKTGALSAPKCLLTRH